MRNALRFVDEGGRIVGELELGALAVDLDGVVSAIPTGAASVPKTAASCVLISGDRILGAGPIERSRS